MGEWFKELHPVFVRVLPRQPRFKFFEFAGMESADVGELQKMAFAGVDKEAFLDNVVELEMRRIGAEKLGGALDMVGIENINQQVRNYLRSENWLILWVHQGQSDALGLPHALSITTGVRHLLG